MLDSTDTTACSKSAVYLIEKSLWNVTVPSAVEIRDRDSSGDSFARISRYDRGDVLGNPWHINTAG